MFYRFNILCDIKLIYNVDFECNKLHPLRDFMWDWERVTGCWRGFLSGARCWLAYGQLMPLPLTVSCFSEVQIGFTFLVPAHLGRPWQRAVKRFYVCVLAVVGPVLLMLLMCLQPILRLSPAWGDVSQDLPLQPAHLEKVSLLLHLW